MTDYRFTGGNLDLAGNYSFVVGNQTEHPSSVPSGDGVSVSASSVTMFGTTSVGTFSGGLLNSGTITATVFEGAADGTPSGPSKGTAIIDATTITGGASAAAGGTIDVADSIAGGVSALNGGTVSAGGAIFADGGTVSAVGTGSEVTASTIAGNILALNGGLVSVGTVITDPTDPTNPISVAANDGTVSITALSSGDLTVSNGGTINASSLTTLGANTGDDIAVEVGGAGSSFNSGASLILGDNGGGGLTVDLGANLTYASVDEGLGASGSGGIAVGGSLTIQNNMTVGDAGTGSLSAGGQLIIGGDLVVANQTAAFASFYVSGAGALVHVLGNATIGQQGRLSNPSIYDGGELEVDNNLVIAAASTSSFFFYMLVSDPGTTLDVGGTMIIADAGTAQVRHLYGAATMIAGNLVLGNQAGSDGSLLLSDENSLNPSQTSPDSISVGGNLVVGEAGKGSIAVVGDDSTLTVGGNLIVAAQPGSSGTLEAPLYVKGNVTLGWSGAPFGAAEIEIGDAGMDVGAAAAAPANTLEIADGAALTGNGYIANYTTTTLNIVNDGKIDAEGGTLLLPGNLSGDGQVLVGENADLEFGDAVADDVTGMYLDDGDPTFTIDDPLHFKGQIDSTNFANPQIGYVPGDSVDLPTVPYIAPGTGWFNGAPYNNPAGASYLFETGQGQKDYVLQVVEGGQTYNIPISQSQKWSGAFAVTPDALVNPGTKLTRLAGAATDYSTTAKTSNGVSPYAGIVKIRLPGGGWGTGFEIGPHLILTAEHVVKGEQTVSLQTESGGTFTGFVLTSLSGTIPTGGLSVHDSSNDYAFVYVPVATFSSSQRFQPDFDFTGGTVNVTGYPSSIFGQAADQHESPLGVGVLAGESTQFNNIGQVSTSGAVLKIDTPNLTVTGNSGGPLWIYNGKVAQAVGIVSTDIYADSIGSIPQANINQALDFGRKIYDDPPSNDARITSAVVLQTGDADTGQIVQFVLSLNENVIASGGGPTLSLSDGGTATYDAADSTGTGLVFDYTIGAGDQTANLEITQVNSTQTVEVPGGATIDFTVLDDLPTDLSINTPLVVHSVASSQSGEASSGQLVHLTLTTSAAVTVNTAGGLPTLALNDGATATYDAGLSNLSAGTLVFDYTVSSGDKTADLEVASVNLPTGTAVENAGGYNADFTAAIDAPTGLQVGAAYVAAIASSLSGDLASGQTDHLTVTMSQAVIVGGSPILSLSDGKTAIYDSGLSNPSGGTLVFDYNVGINDYTSDLQVLGYSPSGATVTDNHSVDADFSGATQYDLALDVNAAIVTSLADSPVNGEADSGQQVTLTLTVSEAVTVNLTGGSPTLSLNDGGTATYDSVASNPSTGALVFDYTVGSGDATPGLQISQVNLNGATIDDANSNAADFSAAANFTTNLQVGPAFATSLTPALSGEIFARQTDQLTLAMSQGVTVNTTHGSPTLSLSDGATATYDSTASDLSSGNLVFDYAVGAGDYATDLSVLSYSANGATVTDANGVNADFSGVAQSNLGLDVNVAIVTGVASSPSSGEATNGQSVTLTLSMSEAVTVNTTSGAPTLSLSTGATATYDSGASNPSAGTLVFDYTVGATDETPDLGVTQVNLNGAKINDANGNAADLSAVSNFDTGLQVGPVFVDSVTPSQSGDITTGQTVQLALSMSGGLVVTGGSPILSLSDNENANYDAAASDPAAGTLVFDYTVGAGDYSTDLAVSGFNPNGATVTDANGISPDFSGLAQSDLGLDVNAAFVSNVTASAATSEADSGQVVTLTVTVSGPVTVNTAGGSPTADLNDGAIATYDSAASNLAAGTLAFSYTVGAADDDPGLQITRINLNGATITDANGNAVDLSAANSIATTLQIGPVFVNSLTPSVTGDLTLGQTVQLTLAMSGGLTLTTNGGPPTLTLSNGATATYDTAYSAPAAGMLVFDYTVGANQQTSNLEVTSVNFPSPPKDTNDEDANFANAVGSSLGLSVSVPVLPIVTAVVETPSTGDLTVGGIGTVALTINEDVTVTGSPTLSLNDGGSATYDAAHSTSTSLVFDYTVISSDTSVSSLAANALNVPAGVSIVDGSANSLNTSLSGLTQTGPEISISSPSPHIVDDFNDNGISDMLWRNTSDNSLVIWLMNGSAVSSGTYVTYQGNAIAPDASWSVAGIGDFNGDGDADILWQQSTTGALVDWSMNGAAIGSSAYVTYQGNAIIPDASWSVAGIGDFNGDGDADILWRQSTSGALVDWSMNGSVVQSPAYLTYQGNVIVPDSSWSVAGIGDFNGDGDADILWRQSTSGALVDWSMNGSVVQSPAYLTYQGNVIVPDSSWSIAGIGDFNGDGDADLLWRQSTTGTLVEWSMNGSRVSSSAYVTIGGTAVAPDATWNIVEVGNFNSGGPASILWQQSTTGSLVEWQMNGAQIASSNFVTSQGNPIAPAGNWQAQARPTDFV